MAGFLRIVENRASSRKRFTGGFEWSALPNLVAKHSAHQCTDVRDHVYALLPLISVNVRLQAYLEGFSGPSVEPDYRKSSSTTFKEVIGPTWGYSYTSYDEEIKKDLITAIQVQRALQLHDQDPVVIEVMHNLSYAHSNDNIVNELLREVAEVVEMPHWSRAWE